MSLPFDLNKLDFDGIRTRRRKRLLLWSLPFCIIAFVIAVGLGALYTSQAAGVDAYKQKKYQQAAETFGRFEFINVIQPYKMKFNQGTAQAAARQYEKAQATLERSLELRPPLDFECQVRVNLVYAIAGRAEALVADKKYDEAILLYDGGKAVVDARDCGMKTSGGKGASDAAKQADETLQKQRNEVTQKQNEAKQQRNGDTPSDQNDTDSTDGENTEPNADNATTPSEDQVKELQDKQSKSASKNRTSRGNARGAQDNGSYSQRDYNKKNW